MAYEAVLAALADPTRRSMVEHLSRRAYTVGELADRVAIRQPSASEHLRVLRRAGLVQDRREGTRRYYSASVEGIEELRRYLESLWGDVLAAYAGGAPPSPRPRAVKHRRRRAGAGRRP